eukprot:jgi/Phyca11/507337/fgenesh2_kg.PHYCAscaffold_27_\
MAIEIDNEVDADEFDVMRMKEVTAGSAGVGGPVGTSNHVAAAPKSDSSSRSSRVSDEDESGTRRRSNTLSSLESESEALRDDDENSDTLSPSQELTMPSVRSRSSIDLKCMENGATPDSRKVKSSGQGDPRRNLDLKRFQPDTQKFSEILGKLKIGTPPRVNNSRASINAGNFVPFSQRNAVNPHNAMNSRSAAELAGLRHVVSTPDLTRMQG